MKLNKVVKKMIALLLIAMLGLNTNIVNSVATEYKTVETNDLQIDDLQVDDIKSIEEAAELEKIGEVVQASSTEMIKPLSCVEIIKTSILELVSNSDENNYESEVSSQYNVNISTGINTDFPYVGDELNMTIEVNSNSQQQEVSALESISCIVYIDNAEFKTTSIYEWSEGDEELNSFEDDYTLELGAVEGLIEVKVVAIPKEGEVCTSNEIIFNILQRGEGIRVIVGVAENQASASMILEDNYYYKSGRVIDITIIDEDFSEELATEGISIWMIENDGTETLVDTQKYLQGWKSNENVHIAQLKFEESGKYKWEYLYENESNDIVEKENQEVSGESPFAFVIDTEEAEISYVCGDVEIQEMDKEFHTNADFGFVVKAKDYEPSAGLKKVSYKIGENEYPLYEFKGLTTDDLVYEYESDSITIDAKTYSDRITKIEIIVEDNAGNVNTSVINVEFDTVAPSIMFKYDNNEVANGKYFKDGRKLTVIIIERESGFDKVAATEQLSIQKNGQKLDLESYKTIWETKLGEELDDAQHILTIELEDEGKYQVGMEYSDNVGNSSGSIIIADGTVSPYEFVVDATESQIACLVNEKIIEHEGSIFINSDIDLVISVSEDEIGSGLAKISYVVNEKEVVVYDHSINSQEDIIYNWISDTIELKIEDYEVDILNVEIIAEDYVGNIIKNNFSVEVDKQTPEITVAYDNNSVKNDYYFNEDRTLIIQIMERPSGFSKQDAILGIDINLTNSAGKSHQLDLSAYENEWVEVLNENLDQTTYTLELPLTDEGSYKVAVDYVDVAGNKNKEVEIVENTANPYSFTIDKSAPEGKVKATAFGGGTRVWDNFLSEYLFGYLTNTGVTVEWEGNDILSGIDSVKYYIEELVMPVSASNALTIAELEKINEWNEYKEYYRATDCYFAVYYKIIDKAGNTTYMCSDAILIDVLSPNVETFQPLISISTPIPQNGIYKGDIEVELKVIEPVLGGIYSGLDEITIEVYNDAISRTNPTQTEYIKLSGTNGTNLVEAWLESFTIDSEKNNSNNIRMVVRAKDRVNNTNVVEKTFMVDITKPAIEIQYSNNSVNNSRYFSDARRAKITVTERNFDEDVVQIIARNLDGNEPKISGWSKVVGTGTGNLDSTQWVAYIDYSQNGDYIFSMECQDLAGNQNIPIVYLDGTQASDEFTIDLINPTFRISYDNNNAKNVNYYNSHRVQTIELDEHNFSAEDTSVSINATNNGSNISSPGVSSWVKNGDVNVAKVSYTQDGLYTVNFNTIDKAGNTNSSIQEESFYIDTTAPEIEITGVENNVAYAGELLPSITITDTNLDSSSINVTLVGEKQGVIKLNTGSSSGVEYQAKLDYFPEEVNKDDIYTLKVNVVDMAGNVAEEEVVFSVNRFGSTYKFTKALEGYLNKYNVSVADLVLSEINVNQLKNIKITLFKNNETLVLKEGADFHVKILGGSGKWYEYEYTIFSKNFEDEGIYKIVVYSEDMAGNISENVLDSKGKELQFGIDKTSPIINVMNIESDTVYADDFVDVNFTVVDNFNLKDVKVVLDEKTVVEWDSSKEEVEVFNFRIDGDTITAHNVEIVSTDEAGNETREVLSDIYVTTSVMVRIIESGIFNYIILALVIISGMTFGLVKKRKTSKK